MAKHKTMIAGDCGEFYVASMLAGVGADVQIERVNAKRIDLNVTFGRRTFTIQVKTGKSAYTNQIRKRIPENSYWVWRAGKKCATIKDSNHWYAFVYLGKWPRQGDPPKVFFVSSAVVVETLRDRAETSGEWFWMYKTEAEAFCGLAGLKKLRKSLVGQR